MKKEKSVFPKTFEGWAYLIAACVFGFFIGQWIRNRRKKTEEDFKAIHYTDPARQEKRLSKKERRKARRLLK
jgi:flagellar biosynthesis/type III secretory pathway M-ring protein FliF/YscJ